MAKTAQDLANDIYKELCAQKADLAIRIQKMGEEMAALDKRIDGINDHVPLLHQLEDRIRAEFKRDSEPPTPIKNVTNLVDVPSSTNE